MSATAFAETNQNVIEQLGYEGEMADLRATIEDWLETTDGEMREMMDWQFLGPSKYFRPMTVFSCYRAQNAGDIPHQIMESALVIEMFHNVSLIVDDIVDKSPERRGKKTLHYQFGELNALMASGYITAEGYERVSEDPYNVVLFSELMKRLGVAEVAQWRQRRMPLGVEDWRRIAGEDTGSMFEVAACLGTRDNSLRAFGGLLGLLYHGCDDVGDVKGLEALGGGGDEDVRDGILTLPAALAIRDREIRDLFCKQDPTDADLDTLGNAFMAMLPEAENYLDQIADEAISEAKTFGREPAPLITIVEHTRQLSGR